MQPVGISFCDGERACYVPLNVSQNQLLSSIGNIFENRNILFIAHNIIFDSKCLKKFCDVEPENIFCTLAGSKLINENLGKGNYKLKVLAHTELGIPEKEIKTWEQASDEGYDSEKFQNYAMNDSIWCYQLYEKIAKKLKEQDLEYVFYQVEMPFQYVIRDLEINGIRVDVNIIDDFIPKCEKMLYNFDTELFDIIGLKRETVKKKRRGKGIVEEIVDPINFNSSQQMANLIQNYFGIKLTKKTKPSTRFPKGQWCVDKKVIEGLVGEHKFFEILNQRNKLETLYSTFISKCKSYMDKDDRIRPSYGMVRTSRYCTSSPNLLNQPNPKKEKLVFNYRKAFVPENGNVFVKADWSGQELCVLAEVSQDERMKNAFNIGQDLHLLTANRIFNLMLSEQNIITTSDEYGKIKDKFKTERHRAKNGVNFPVIYGKHFTTLAKDFNISKDEAKRWMDEFHSLYPRVQDAIDLTKVELEKYGYVVNLMGRRRRFPGYKNGNEWEQNAMLRQAFNYKIQSFSAEIAKIAGNKLKEILPKYNAKFVLFVYDEWVIECPEKYSIELSKKVKEIMEGCVSMSVPLSVDVNITKDFGE